MDLKLVFVYGTLKSRQPNHGLIQNIENGYAKYIGDASTVDRFPLVIASEYNIPFLLQFKGEGQRVMGEVYQVCDKMVNALDELESHPHFYQRFVTPVQLETNSRESVPNIIECWCYFLTNFKSFLLNLPFLISYDNEGPHGLAYAPSYNRRAADNYDLFSEVKNCAEKS